MTRFLARLWQRHALPSGHRGRPVVTDCMPTEGPDAMRELRSALAALEMLMRADHHHETPDPDCVVCLALEMARLTLARTTPRP